METPDRSAAGVNTDPTVDEILEVMARAGLPISMEDAARLVPSVRRTRAMAAEVRRLIADTVEPSGPGTSPGEASS